MPKKKKTSVNRFNLYVIDLKKTVLKVRKFNEVNQHYTPEKNKPCVYVGSTAKTPEQRFDQHKQGGRYSNRFVKEFGIRLRRSNYEKDNPIIGDRNDAERKERALAKKLRKKGYAVYQN